MTLRTSLCELLEIEYPIVQAPIGSATCPALAAAAADAGGLGQLAVTWCDLVESRRLVSETRERTDEPFAVNLVLDEATTVHDTADHLEVVLEAGAEIVSLSFGDPGPAIERVHDAGALAVVTVTSAAEAREAVASGADAVVAQGVEAGGHVGSEVATTALVPRVAETVDVPVIAAGGIADGRAVAAALSLGADGVWVGTRFVATEEAAVADRYRERLRESDGTDTRLTTAFDKGWPGMPHRVLENETLRQWEAAGRPPPGERPGEDEVVATTGDGEPIERYEEALATPDVSGDVDAMALYAGQGVGSVDAVRPAGEVVDDLVTETLETIEELSAFVDG